MYSNELYHYGVLGMKLGVHRAKSYATKAKKARVKGDAASARKYENKSKALTAKTNKLSGGKNIVNRVSKQSFGKTVAQTALFGSYGAMKYNQARAKHVSRGKAAFEAVLYKNGNYLTGGLLSVIEPRT